MNRNGFLIGLIMVAGLGFMTVPALALERTVDCDKGQSLQDAITKTRSSAAPLIVHVKGTCYERVRNSRDLLVIDGHNEAVIHGSVINWGTRLTIRNIEITGADAGIRASSGRTRLLGVHLVDNEGEGLVLDGSGVVYFNGGSVRNNGLAGVSAESGTVAFNNVDISGNRTGIDAAMSRITLQNTRVIDNIGPGLRAYLHSGIIVNGPATIEGNTENGVRLELDSGLLTRGPVSITGNAWVDVYCHDNESSAKFDGTYPGSAWCSDFNW